MVSKTILAFMGIIYFAMDINGMILVEIYF